MAGKKYWKISWVVMVITSENIGFITSSQRPQVINPIFSQVMALTTSNIFQLFWLAMHYFHSYIGSKVIKIEMNRYFPKFHPLCNIGLILSYVIIVIGAFGANYTFCNSLLSWSSVKRRVLENKMYQKLYPNWTLYNMYIVLNSGTIFDTFWFWSSLRVM